MSQDEKDRGLTPETANAEDRHQPGGSTTDGSQPAESRPSAPKADPRGPNMSEPVNKLMADMGAGLIAGSTWKPESDEGGLAAARKHAGENCSD